MDISNMSNNMRFAVLIDAENIPHSSIQSVMKEIAIYGTPTVKRIYGVWTNPAVSGWKQDLLENAITPIQQYSYTSGKNSSDSAMIIDAMDILYTGNTDGFVLVSSDSDFTRLAIRLREAGQKVIGIGEKKTPNPFIVACDKFIYIEVIRDKVPVAEKSKAKPAEKTKAKPETAPKPKEPLKNIPEEVITLISDSVSDLSGEDEWVFMGELGNLLVKKQPDFDSRNFGFKNLSGMIKSIPGFEVESRHPADPNNKHRSVGDTAA